MIQLCKLPLPISYALFFAIGSIPFAKIWSALFGKHDITKYGSGNVGTSNAWRVNGKVVGILTGLSDILKGFIAYYLMPENMMMHGAFAVLGHMYAPWTNGKGVATFFGVCAAVIGFPALIPAVLWINVVKMSKNPSKASYMAIMLMIIISLFRTSDADLYIIVLLSIAIIHKHYISRKYKESLSQDYNKNN